MRLTRTILLSMLLLSGDDQSWSALGMRTNIESLHKEQLSKEKKLYSIIRPQHMYKTRISALRSNTWMPKRVRYKVLAAASKADTTQEPEPFELEDGWKSQTVLATKAIGGRKMEMSVDSETDNTQEPESFELEEMTTQEPEPFELESFKSSTSLLTEEHYPDGTLTSTLVPMKENSEVYHTISAAPTMYSTEMPESEDQASKRGYDKEKRRATAKSSLVTGHDITEQAILYSFSYKSSAGNREISQIEYSDSKKMRKTQETIRPDVAHRFITSAKALIEKTWKSETRASTESKTVQAKDVKVARSMTASTKKFFSKPMSSKERRTRKEQTKKTVLPLFITHSKASTEKTNETKVQISALITSQARQRAPERSIARQISTFQLMDDTSSLRKEARKEQEIRERDASTSIQPAETTRPRKPDRASLTKLNIAASNTEGPSQNSIESGLIRSTEILSSNKSQGDIFINIFLFPNLAETRNTRELVLPKLSTATHVEPTTVFTKGTLHEEKEKEKLVSPKDATHDSKDTMKATAQSLTEKTVADKVDLNSKTVKATAQYLTERTEADKVNHNTTRAISTIVVTKESLVETAGKRSVAASTKADAPAETAHKLHEFTTAMPHTVGKTLKPTDSMETKQQREPVGSSTTFSITTAVDGEATTIHKEASEEKMIDHISTFKPTIMDSSSFLSTEGLPSLSRYRTLSGANEAVLADSTENNIDAPSTTTDSESTGENAPMEESRSTSEDTAIDINQIWINDTDQTDSNSSVKQALLSEKQQRTEQRSTSNVLYHYNNIISVELLLVTALILVCVLFALLLVAFLAVRNERKIQRERAGFIAEALHEVERNDKVIKTTLNKCDEEAPPPVIKPSKLSKPHSKKETKPRLLSENTLNETRSTFDERSHETDVCFEIVPKPRNTFNKKHRRFRRSSAERLSGRSYERPKVKNYASFNEDSSLKCNLIAQIYSGYGYSNYKEEVQSPIT